MDRERICGVCGGIIARTGTTDIFADNPCYCNEPELKRSEKDV